MIMLKVKEGKKKYCDNPNQKKDGMTTLISVKVDFRAKNVHISVN